MSKPLTSIAIALATLASAPAAHAAPAAPPPPVIVRPQADVYEGLMAAMESGLDQQVMMEGTLDTVIQITMNTNPVLRGSESAHPGITAALRDAVRPLLAAYSARVSAQYRPRMLQEMRTLFTVAEAQALTAFYTSASGRRMMQLMSGNMQHDTVTTDYLEDGRVSADAVNRDLTSAAMQSLNQMSKAERDAMVRQALSTPGYAKLPLLQQRTAPIRAEMESAPPTGEEASAMIAAVQRVAQDFGLLPG